MKKHLLILSILIFVSNKIFAVTTFTGVTAKNKSGKTLEIMIDTGKDGWVTVKDGESAKLKSDKSSGRFIHWRESKNDTHYKTQKGYNSPDTITIKDSGKKYDMTSSVGGIDKDNNKEAKVEKESAKEKAAKEKEKAAKEKEKADLNSEINKLKKEVKAIEAKDGRYSKLFNELKNEDGIVEIISKNKSSKEKEFSKISAEIDSKKNKIRELEQKLQKK